jgi:hypothetical protein
MGFVLVAKNAEERSISFRCRSGYTDKSWRRDVEYAKGAQKRTRWRSYFSIWLGAGRARREGGYRAGSVDVHRKYYHNYGCLVKYYLGTILTGCGKPHFAAHSEAIQKRITWMADLRNKAARGKMTEFSASDVETMLR